MTICSLSLSRPSWMIDDIHRPSSSGREWSLVPHYGTLIWIFQVRIPIPRIYRSNKNRSGFIIKAPASITDSRGAFLIKIWVLPFVSRLLDLSLSLSLFSSASLWGRQLHSWLVRLFGRRCPGPPIYGSVYTFARLVQHTPLSRAGTAGVSHTWSCHGVNCSTQRHQGRDEAKKEWSGGEKWRKRIV